MSHVREVFLVRRLDKRKDRVEIASASLTAAIEHAEVLSVRSGRPTRVLGWYHSHPHITVWPSHVGALQTDGW